MRVLAIETNVGKLKRQFLNETEQEIITIPKHVFQFFMRFLQIVLILGLFLGAMVGLTALGLPPVIAVPGVVAGCVIAGLLTLVAYAEWRFDFILMTTDKMVVVDSSFLRQTVMPINLEHVSSVTAQTRYANLFGFGTLHFLLKDEPARQRLDVDYVPHVAVVSARISDVITDFQRRKMRVGAPVLEETAQHEGEMKVYEARQDAQVQAAQAVPGQPVQAPQKILGAAYQPQMMATDPAETPVAPMVQAAPAEYGVPPAASTGIAGGESAAATGIAAGPTVSA